MKIDPNAPAYPSELRINTANDFSTMATSRTVQMPGMTIRAAMATQIMAGLCANFGTITFRCKTVETAEQRADLAVCITDALIAALNREKA